MDKIKLKFTKIRDFLIFIMSMILFYNCYVIPTNNFPSDTTFNTYDNVRGGISKYIRIDGYYSTDINFSPPISEINENECFGQSLIFFNDGCFSWFDWRESLPIYITMDNLNLSSHIKKYGYPINPWRIFSCFYKQHELCGGLYVISGDTIYTEQISLGYYSTREFHKFAFKIKNRTTLIMLYHEEVTKDSVIHHKCDNFEPSHTFLFHPATALPSTICMFDKNLKYRWNDKKNWKEYHKKRKEYIRARRKHN